MESRGLSGDVLGERTEVKGRELSSKSYTSGTGKNAVIPQVREQEGDSCWEGDFIEFVIWVIFGAFHRF